jgi:hypothetical protein
MNEQYHRMILEKEHPSGEEDWYCPTCGRRFIVNWEPKFKRRVIEIGDENAVHSGGKGGLQMGTSQVKPVDAPLAADEPVISVDDPSLAPWANWLDEAGFEDLWNEKD